MTGPIDMQRLRRVTEKTRFHNIDMFKYFDLANAEDLVGELKGLLAKISLAGDAAAPDTELFREFSEALPALLDHSDRIEQFKRIYWSVLGAHLAPPEDLAEALANSHAELGRFLPPVGQLELTLA